MSRSFDYFADCDTCHGPVRHKTRWELVRDWLAYEIWMALPTSIGMTKPGLWLLSYAGGYAYTCTCPAKVLKAAPPLENGGEHA